MNEDDIPDLKVGDCVIDEDGDGGIVIVDKPDSNGDIIWICTQKATKQAMLGAYYQLRPDELTKIYAPDTLESFVAWALDNR